MLNLPFSPCNDRLKIFILDEGINLVTVTTTLLHSIAIEKAIKNNAMVVKTEDSHHNMALPEKEILYGAMKLNCLSQCEFVRKKNSHIIKYGYFFS
jgi:hypothetical protein